MRTVGAYGRSRSCFWLPFTSAYGALPRKEKFCCSLLITLNLSVETGLLTALMSSICPDLTKTCTESDAERLLLALFRALRPRCIFNVNSRLCWQYTRRFGSRTGDISVFAYLFCWDQTSTGGPELAILQNSFQKLRLLSQHC